MGRPALAGAAVDAPAARVGGLLGGGVVAVGVADDDVPAVLGELLAGEDLAAGFLAGLGVVAALVGDGLGGVMDLLASDCDSVGVVLFVC